MCAMHLNITSEVRNAFQELRKSRVPYHTIVLSTDTTELSVNLVSEFKEGIPLEDVAATLPTNAPRIIICMPERVHPDGRKSYPMVLIPYCPPNLSPQANIVFSNARSQIALEFQLQNIWEVKKKYGLSNETLAEKLASGKW